MLYSITSYYSTLLEQLPIERGIGHHYQILSLFIFKEFIAMKRTLLLLICFYTYGQLSLAQNFEWSRTGISPGYEYGNSIATDDSGNVLIAGQIEYTTNFDGNVQVSSAGQHDIFVAKYHPDGNLVWLHRAGGTDGDVAAGIGVDRYGNSYVTGEVELTADFGSGMSLTAAGANDGFLAKYNPNGQLLWTVIVGGSTSDDRGLAIAVDDDGYSYVTGAFGGTAHYGSSTLVSGNGGQDCFVVKFDPNGHAIWARKGGGNGDDRGRGISLDGQGHLFVSGSFNGFADFSGTRITDANGVESAFLTSYDTSGNFRWALPFRNCCGTTKSYGVSNDGTGNSYVTGYFESTLEADGQSLTSQGGWDMFVCKVNTTGHVSWIKRGGGNYEDFGEGCHFDRSHDVLYVTGQFDDHGAFDTLPVYSHGNRDLFVAAYNHNGEIEWIRTGGGIGRDAGIAITTDLDNNIYSTGFFNDTATFGGATVSGYPLADFILTKLNLNAVNEPTVPASTLLIDRIQCIDVRVTCQPGSGSRRIMVVHEGTAITALPVDGNSYIANSNFGTGSDLGNGNYVVYDGSGSSVTISGLLLDSTYTFAVFEYDGAGISINYLTGNYPIASITMHSFSVQVIASTTSICNGDQATLSATAGQSYSWSPANGLSSTVYSSVVASPSSTTTYTVIATDINACTATANVVINVLALPIVTLSPFPAVCQNDPVFALQGGLPLGGTYSINGNISNVFIPGLSGNSLIVYNYTDAHGCTDAAMQSILVHHSPIIDLGTDTVVCITSTVILDPGQGYQSYAWMDGSTGSTYHAIFSGTDTLNVTVTVTDSGCIAIDSILVIYDACLSVTAPITKDEVSIFPNPAHSTLTIFLNKFPANNLSIRLDDLQGRTLLDVEAKANPIELNIPNTMASGIYLLMISDPEINSLTVKRVSVLR